MKQQNQTIVPTDVSKPVIRTHFNARFFPQDHEKNKQPSLTVPDQSLTVKQLMDRFAKGLPLDGERVPYYEPEEDMTDLSFLPDPATLDLADRQQLAEQAQEQLNEIKDRVNELHRLRQKQKAAKQLEQQFPKPAEKPAEKPEPKDSDKSTN